MFKRLFFDIGISFTVLIMIGSAYFMSAQKIIKQTQGGDGFELCLQMGLLEENLQKLQLRQGLIKTKNLPVETKMKLVLGYEEQIDLYKKRITNCEVVNK